MRAILLLTILMTSGDFDKQKQKQFEKERPLFPRNHQNGLSKINLTIISVYERQYFILRWYSFFSVFSGQLRDPCPTAPQ
jgi:hypothetical protein